MKICIGIISYFPNDATLRSHRSSACFNLLSTLNDRFRLPILLVAQNWSSFEIDSLNKYSNQSISILKYGKLGIVGARMKLRDYFLNQTDYDYIILLDDDSVLEIKSNLAVSNYIAEINKHPGMVGSWKTAFPRLMAVSREMYLKHGYTFIETKDPEKEECWEDHCWFQVLKQLWPDKIFDFNKEYMSETSLYSENDPYSVYYAKWVNDGKDAKARRNGDMLRKSSVIIEEWKEFYKRMGIV